MTIWEAWQNVKAAAADVYAKYSVTHPHWQYEDSPLKYVDPNRVLEATFAKAVVLAAELDLPAGYVFEIGPGAGYLLYVLREVYYCDVYGCDVKDRPLYRELHHKLQLWNVYGVPVQRGRCPSQLEGRYKLIAGTQISWMDEWAPADLASFLSDCRRYLSMSGRIVLFPNPRALPAFKGCGGQEIELPFLGRGYVFSATP